MAVHDRLTHEGGNIRSLFVSSPQGHSGKTVVSIGLCYLLKGRGLSVQAFKKGPDYIDPSWLTAATGRSCRNLDPFLIPQEKLIHSFYRASRKADLAIIEGVMGLYDGLDSTPSGTSAEVARLLKAPILLVVNASRMTDSIAALVSGYQHFQPETNIAGIILNRVSGCRHEQKLRNAVEKYCKIPVVGSIPWSEGLQIAERHLGLIPTRESSEAETWVEGIGKELEPRLDVKQILAIAERFKTPRPPQVHTERKEYEASPHVKIGVIFDRVFNFYYPENLEGLKEAGADLVFIHSLQDRLPQVDGLYIGGGFPEFFLEELEKNKGLRQDISEAIEGGLPVYAECAGLMYLSRRISWQGKSHEMVGTLPSEVTLSNKPEGHGYVVAEVIGENPFFPVGLTLRGHEFHHSKLSLTGDLPFAYEIKRGHGVDGKRDGIVYKNLFASYIHLHALGTPEWAQGFVRRASKGRAVKPRLQRMKGGTSFPGVA
jgi:cobyrinic acid a,c-diamide synthase